MAGNVPHPKETNIVRIVQAVRDLFEGRSNAVGTVTLRDGQTTTSVTAQNCGPDSRVILMPTSATAATDFASGSLYVSSVSASGFVITHPNTADTDKVFFWVALG